MIALLLVGVVVVAGIVLVTSRFAGAKAERRSVASYERALDVLGGVTKRSDHVAPVQVPLEEELGRPHVGPAGIDERAAPEPTRRPPEPRVRPEMPARPHLSLDRIPVFGDVDLVGDPAPTAILPIHVEPARESPGPRNRPLEPAPTTEVARLSADRSDEQSVMGDTEPLHHFGSTAAATSRARRGSRPANLPPASVTTISARRAATGAAAAVALGALAVGGWQLTSRQNSPSGPTIPRNIGTRTSGGDSTRTTPAVTSLKATSASSSLVTYMAPAGALTITFNAKGPCWVGAETSESDAGPWSWMAEPGMANGPATATYHSPGPIVIRLGAPALVTVTVNGLPVELPAGKVQPYDIALVADTSTSA